MKLIIDIPENAKQAFDNAESNDLKGGYYDHGGIIGKAIQNGIPLDDVLDKIEAEIKETRKRRNVGVMECLDIIDRYKAENIDPNDLTHMFDGVTEIPKDVFKDWFSDSAPLKDCKNTAESYGEICVKCNKCGRFDKHIGDKG